MKKLPRTIVMQGTNIPIINPEIVTGVSLMLLFVFFAARMNFEFGFVTLIIAHITFDVPYVILNIMPKFRQMNPHLYEAAQDLGANPVQVFFKAVLPLSMPGVMSGIMMVFMPTISTFAIAELLTMNNIKLFGTTIQENINNSMWNYGAALSLIMLLLIAATSLFSTDDKENSNEGGGLW